MDTGGILDRIKGLEKLVAELTKKQGGGSTSPLTTKGDLYGFDTAGNRVPIGANKTILVADSTQALGLKWQSIVDAIYPVGAIYMSVVNTSPATLFGGTWSAWGSGKVPVGVDTGDTSFDTVEETGGAKTHTLTSGESGLKDHTHNIGIETTGGYVPNGITPNAFLRGSFGNGDTRNGYPTDRPVSAVVGSGMVQGVPGGASNASSAHNNLQPYITCYMWKRTA